MPDAVGRLILIVLPSLAGGGAERIRLVLADEFLRLGFRVEFVVISGGGELENMVPAGANITNLNSKTLAGGMMQLSRIIRQRRPDCVLAAMWGLTVISIIAHRLAGGPGSIVISDHEILSLSNMGRQKWLRRAMALSIRLFYPLARARIAVSRGAADDLARLGGISRAGIRVIYNPAYSADLCVQHETPGQWARYGGKWILAVGKFKREKAFHVLVSAMRRVCDQVDAQLVVLGDGDLRAGLEAQISDLDLSDRVSLPGFVHDTSPWYANADLFVMSSTSEGFGNVIVEALQYGVPVVSTDCPSGPREILADGEYGRLVPCNDPQALADAMLAALQETPDREKLQRRARDFAPDRIALEYLDVMFPGEGWLDAKTGAVDVKA